MRYATDIKLDQIIVHILNPWQPNGFVLSERELPLDSNPHLVDYFVAHIQNSLQDPAAKAARFIALDDEAVSGMCKALLDGGLNLVKGSRRLAQRLYGIIAGDGRISPGDLAICFYRAGNRPQVPRYLALLKIDPSEAFRHKTERDAQGKLYVSFETESDVMPTTRERLQKCAFIQSVDPESEYDMMLLDRQVTPREPRPVARFFIEGFLGAELALDPRDRTRRWYVGAAAAHNKLRPDLSPAEDEKLRTAIEDTVTSDYVNMDNFLDSLPLSRNQKKQIDQVVSKVLPDREFEIDRTFAAKLTSKRRFRGDYGLRVDLRADRYSQVIQSVELIRQPGAPPYYRIVIHSQKWEEVVR